MTAENNNQEEVKEELENQEDNVVDVEDSNEEIIEEQTVEQILEAKVLKLEEEVKEAEDKYLRLYAEFENFKKRKNQEIETNNKYKSQSVISSILPSLDNLERALEATEETEATEALLKGVTMVYEGIQNALKNEGVEVVTPTGEQFDPNYHQAVMQDSDEDKESGIVLETFQKGYTLKDRVIRPAMVKVNN